MSVPHVSVKVWGEFALFSRPELKVERVSYPVMTPSAARGVLDAILYKPQMMWHIRRIKVLQPNFPAEFPGKPRELPYRLVSIRRNEIQGKIALRTVDGWMKAPHTFEPYLVDSAGRESIQGQNRTQRNSLVLQHVAYVIEATPKLTSKANLPRLVPHDEEDTAPDSVTKYVAMFQRRVARGQCFHRPYLGIREFACQFTPPDDNEMPIPWTDSLGLMLYDIRFGANGKNQPGFFDAKIKNGVMHCDTDAESPAGDGPVQVYGWNNS